MINLAYPCAMATDLARRLKEARERTPGLSQDAAGEKLGITGKAISGWEAGRGGPARWRLQKVATLYGVNLLWLLEGEGPMVSSDPANEFLTHPTEHGVTPDVGHQSGERVMTPDEELMNIIGALSQKGLQSLLAEARRLWTAESLPAPFAKDRRA